MRVVVLAESRVGEKRVAASPKTIAGFIGQGHESIVVAGAGLSSGITDAAFIEAGASLADNNEAALRQAELILCVGPPLESCPAGAGLLGLLEPDRERVAAYAEAGLVALAMELVPRISRAQAMDALSSQANLAGYRAVIEAASLYHGIFPMMMTAAGSIAPARVFVMGAGVAGLQAIATARRLGAMVSATDVRPAAKEQVESLAAKFIAVEDEEFQAAETATGYAKPMSAEYQARQASLIAEHISTQDIVITTALIPGRKAPILISEEMVSSMRPGSVIIDMAVAQGGNCPLSRPDADIEHNGVIIAGRSDLPSAIARDASALYAGNLAAFVPLLTGEDGAFAPDWDDEIITASALTRAGKIIHPAFGS